MGGTPMVYVICDQNCKWEGMTKEQILTAIIQAVNEGTIGDIDTGFVTTIKTINGIPLKFFVGEQHEYEALTDEEKNNLYAIITNDTTKYGIEEAIKQLRGDFEDFAGAVLEGDLFVHTAKKALVADKANIANGLGIGLSLSGEEYAKITSGGIYCVLFGASVKDLSADILFIPNGSLYVSGYTVYGNKIMYGSISGKNYGGTINIIGSAEGQKIFGVIQIATFS